MYKMSQLVIDNRDFFLSICRYDGYSAWQFSLTMHQHLWDYPQCVLNKHCCEQSIYFDLDKFWVALWFLMFSMYVLLLLLGMIGRRCGYDPKEASLQNEFRTYICEWTNYRFQVAPPWILLSYEYYLLLSLLLYLWKCIRRLKPVRLLIKIIFEWESLTGMFVDIVIVKILKLPWIPKRHKYL